MLFEIDDKIVSQDILTEPFACDPSKCHGACCVEGDSGAPLEQEELLELEESFEAFKKFMTPEGLQSTATLLPHLSMEPNVHSHS